MINSLDEAIKHCEEVAYRNEILMKRYDDASGYNRSHNEKIRTNGAKGCEQLISLYRQIAEWLRELKWYREDTCFADLYERVCEMCDEARKNFYDTKEDIYRTRLAERLVFKQMLLDKMIVKFGEVNADENND